MELEIVAGGHDGMLVGCSVDLLQEPEHQVLRKKYHEKGHHGIIGCVASGGRYLASGGMDETIQLYDMRKHMNVGTLLHHEASITCLCFHKETHLLSASEDGIICLWSCGRGWDLVHTLAGHKYSVTSVSVHPSGKLALSAGKDRTVRTWNLSTGHAAFTLRLPKAADLVEWSPIGDRYVLAVGGTLTVYSVESGECTVVIEVEKQINSIAFVQDSVVALGSGVPDVLLYSTSTGKQVTRLSGHTNRMKGLALSPDSRLLFSVSSDGTIKAWSLPDSPKSLKDCRCVSTLDAGLRLTCVTALLPEKLSEGGGRRGEKGRARTQSTGRSTGQEESGHKNTVKSGQDTVKPPGQRDMVKTGQEQDTVKSPGQRDMVKPPGQGDMVKSPGQRDMVKTEQEQDAVKSPGQKDTVQSERKDRSRHQGEVKSRKVKIPRDKEEVKSRKVKIPRDKEENTEILLADPEAGTPRKGKKRKLDQKLAKQSNRRKK